MKMNAATYSTFLNGISAVHTGEQICPPGHSYGPHVRSAHLLHFVISGRGIFRVGDTEYTLSAGDAFFIRPGEVTYYRADNSDPWHYAWIGIAGTDEREIFDCISDKQPIFRMKNADLLNEEIIKFVREKEPVSAPQRLAYIGKLCTLFSLFAENVPERTPYKPSGHVYAEKAISYIHAHIDSRITMAELSAYVCIDRSYLSAVFRRHIGVSPQQYIIRTKMNNAAAMLETADYTVTQIAASVGYDDPLLFSRMFRKQYGMSPRAWRERCEKMPFPSPFSSCD